MMNPSQAKLSTFPLGVALAATLAVLCTSCADQGPKPWAMRPITQDYTFPARDEAGNVLPDGWTVSAADLNLGRESYVHYCHACHGMNGDGKGPSSYGLRPPPRDFRVASFKFAAVRSGELPNDDDLMRIVKGGLHGTPMLPWDIPDEELWRILQFIKTFPQPPCDAAKSGKAKCEKELAEFPDGEPSKWLTTYTKGKKKGQPKPTGDPVVITEDPWQGKATEAIQTGADLYHAKAQCANCHPAYLTKKEYYEASLRIDKEHPITSFRDHMYGSIVLAAKDNPYGVNIMPPDFTLNPLRSIRDGEELTDLYRLIASGVGGVMPAWVDGLKQNDLWAIAHYVHSLQQLAQATNRDELAKLRDKLANQPPWVPPSKEPKKVTVGIGAEGKLTLDGEAVDSNEALTAKLKKLAEGDQPVEATIEAEAEVKQEEIVAVLDVIKSAGVDKVAINQPSGDDDEGDDDDDDEQGGDTAEPAPAPEAAPEPKAPAPAPAPKAPAPKAPAPKAPAPKAPAPKAPAPKAPPPSDTPYD